MPDIKAIYVHVPFCKRKCKYCTFASYCLRENDIPAYLNGVKKELELRSAGGIIDTVYFGGGTPSLLSVAQIAGILDTIKNNFDLRQDAEITVEVNPGTVDLKYLSDLNKAGINRLSLGVQSFNDAELEMLGRIHTAKEALKVIDDANGAGFSNLNLDLIYGLPGQSLKSWEGSLLKALETNPAHLSLYALTLEPEDLLFKEINSGKYPEISPDTAAEQYELAEKLLKNHGYTHYEISNWAKPGAECCHNLVYWQGGRYLGIGVAAHSFIENRRTANTADLDQYLDALSCGKPPPQELNEIIPVEIDIAESVILGLRLCGGIDLSHFQKRFNIDIMEWYKEPIGELLNIGLIETDKNLIRLTPHGRLLGNEVFWRFLPDTV
ncbi:MAG: radical SAM family heme chaperone HemW [Dehalococcoidales bacterium]